MCSSPGTKLCSISCLERERGGCGRAFLSVDVVRRRQLRLESCGRGLTEQTSNEDKITARMVIDYARTMPRFAKQKSN